MQRPLSEPRDDVFIAYVHSDAEEKRLHLFKRHRCQQFDDIRSAKAYNDEELLVGGEECVIE